MNLSKYHGIIPPMVTPLRDRAMAAAIAYNIFAGSEIATQRSLIMTLVLLGATLADRP